MSWVVQENTLLHIQKVLWELSTGSKLLKKKKIFTEKVESEMDLER